MDIWVNSILAITRDALINTEFLFAVLRAATLSTGLLGPMVALCAALGGWPCNGRHSNVKSQTQISLDDNRYTEV